MIINNDTSLTLTSDIECNMRVNRNIGNVPGTTQTSGKTLIMYVKREFW